MNRVLIRGDGVAARCCAHLLARSGFQISLEPSRRAPVPAIMLSEPAQQLLRDVFEQPNLFCGLPRIIKRVVAWGPRANPVAVSHSAVVISESALLDRLPAPDDSAGTDADWTVCAAPPLPASAEQHRFGSRMATLAAVESQTGTCWIESLNNGWLFLIEGWLVAVGAPPEDLLGQSRLVKDQIVRRGSASLQFPASPRMATPLGGDRWIACGGAAMAFDPLCGDGTAHAVREAILAAAVIRAAQRGNEHAPLLAHYEARLTAGFERHLVNCRPFYASGGQSEWWSAEAHAVDRGLAWCHARIQAHGGFRFRLNGLELEPLPS